jgi:apolipoprotein N-acyltransferase
MSPRSAADLALDVSFTQKRIASAFSTGWWFGLGYLAFGLYWISSAFIARGSEFAPWGRAGGVAIAASLAVLWFGGVCAGVPLWTRDVRRVLFSRRIVHHRMAAAIFTAAFPGFCRGYVWTPGGRCRKSRRLWAFTD